MKKLWIVLVAITALLALTFAVADPVASTARVSVRKLDNDQGFASGVVLFPGVVLTAHHVVIHGTLRLDEGNLTSEVIALGNGNPLDIALLRFPAADARCPCARLADYPALLDEKVWVVGYPGNIAQIMNTGTAQGTMPVTIQTSSGLFNFGKRLVLAVPVLPGNSGGGVFVHRDGVFQLVGIVVEGMGHITLAI